MYVWFKEVRTFGLLEEYYTRARELGVIFTRYDNDSKPEIVSAGTAANGKPGTPVRVAYTDPYLQRRIELPLDLLVLATPTVASDGASELSQDAQGAAPGRRLLPRGARQAAPRRLRLRGHLPLRRGPLPEEHRGEISQAYAAAGRAAAILAKPALKAGGVVAEVDQDKCAACLTCVRICPYEVPTIDPVAKKAVIEAAACQGCGVCVSECPAKAIVLHHYTDAQIFAKEEALTMEVS